MARDFNHVIKYITLPSSIAAHLLLSTVSYLLSISDDSDKNIHCAPPANFSRLPPVAEHLPSTSLRNPSGHKCLIFFCHMDSDNDRGSRWITYCTR